MTKFITYHYKDEQVFGHEAFSMLIPEGWVVSGGLVWRQHATMPAAISLSLRSPDGLHELNMHPAMPYFWNRFTFGLFSSPEGTYYMGNEIRKPAASYMQYLQQYVLPKCGYQIKVTHNKRFPELESALRAENQGGFGCRVTIDAGIAGLEYEYNGHLFEGNISCGIAVTDMPNGCAAWIADKIISTRTPKGQLTESEKVFSIILNSFRFNLQWFNMYQNYVQALTQYVLQDIYNAGIISSIITNTFNHISDTVRRSYEYQQSVNSKVFRGISESVRGVNSYYDPNKGYNVEMPNGYRYVYSNALGEYYVTDNPSDNPNLRSNLSWTILNQV